jgi:hypothetical protein
MKGRIRSGTNHTPRRRRSALRMNNHSPITIIVAALALAVLRIVLKHPALLQRQVCITDMLWHIGIGQRPYQGTATLGYDNLDERFIQLAGESRSLLPDLRQAFQAYNLWTEGEGQFWVFWKPAPPLFLASSSSAFTWSAHTTAGCCLSPFCLCSQFCCSCSSIPFPAYRYAYPSVVMVTLLERRRSQSRLHAGIRSL